MNNTNSNDNDNTNSLKCGVGGVVDLNESHRISLTSMNTTATCVTPLHENKVKKTKKKKMKDVVTVLLFSNTIDNNDNNNENKKTTNDDNVRDHGTIPKSNVTTTTIIANENQPNEIQLQFHDGGDKNDNNGNGTNRNPRLANFTKYHTSDPWHYANPVAATTTTADKDDIGGASKIQEDRSDDRLDENEKKPMQQQKKTPHNVMNEPIDELSEILDYEIVDDNVVVVSSPSMDQNDVGDGKEGTTKDDVVVVMDGMDDETVELVSTIIPFEPNELEQSKKNVADSKQQEEAPPFDISRLPSSLKFVLDDLKATAVVTPIMSSKSWDLSSSLPATLGTFSFDGGQISSYFAAMSNENEDSSAVKQDANANKENGIQHVGGGAKEIPPHQKPMHKRIKLFRELKEKIKSRNRGRDSTTTSTTAAKDVAVHTNTMKRSGSKTMMVEMRGAITSSEGTATTNNGDIITVVTGGGPQEIAQSPQGFLDFLPLPPTIPSLQIEIPFQWTQHDQTVTTTGTGADASGSGATNDGLEPTIQMSSSSDSSHKKGSLSKSEKNNTKKYKWWRWNKKDKSAQVVQNEEKDTKKPEQNQEKKTSRIWKKNESSSENQVTKVVEKKNAIALPSNDSSDKKRQADLKTSVEAMKAVKEGPTKIAPIDSSFSWRWFSTTTSVPSKNEDVAPTAAEGVKPKVVGHEKDDSESLSNNYDNDGDTHLDDRTDGNGTTENDDQSPEYDDAAVVYKPSWLYRAASTTMKHVSTLNPSFDFEDDYDDSPSLEDFDFEDVGVFSMGNVFFNPLDVGPPPPPPPPPKVIVVEKEPPATKTSGEDDDEEDTSFSNYVWTKLRCVNPFATTSTTPTATTIAEV